MIQHKVQYYASSKSSSSSSPSSVVSVVAADSVDTDARKGHKQVNVILLSHPNQLTSNRQRRMLLLLPLLPCHSIRPPLLKQLRMFTRIRHTTRDLFLPLALELGLPSRDGRGDLGGCVRAREEGCFGGAVGGY